MMTDMWECVNTNKRLDFWLTQLRQAKRAVIDTETQGLRVQLGQRVAGVSIYLPRSGIAPAYFPVRHARGRNLPWSGYQCLIECFNESTFTQTGWNYKFDMRFLAEDGFERFDNSEDVMLAAHLVNENERSYRLKDWACKYIDENAAQADIALKNLLADQGLGKGDMWQLSGEEVTWYATDDVVLTEKARSICIDALRTWGLRDLWFTGINPYMQATARMEMRGLLLDRPLIRKYIAECEAKIGESRAIIEKMAGYPINLNSSKQLQRFLGVPTTAKEYLESLEGENPAIDALLTYRQWEKVRGAYYERYLEVCDQRTGVLYPNIKLHGTIAGRPSCEDPNMQAVPRKTEIYKVKDVFIARPGYIYLSADYAQAELRLGSYLANDTNMIAALLAGGDIHQTTADLTGLDRDSAKRINFAVVYGIGVPGLAARLKVTHQESASFLKKYHKRFHRLKPAYKKAERKARKLGYTRIWTGRVRRHYSEPFKAYHKAFSNLVQGGVAEIMRLTILRLDTEMHKPGGRLRGAYMLLQVHDQILFEIPIKRLARYAALIRDIMEDFPQFTPRPKVDLSVGSRWGALTKYEIPDDTRISGSPIRLRRKRSSGQSNGQSVRRTRPSGRSKRGSLVLSQRRAVQNAIHSVRMDKS